MQILGGNSPGYNILGYNIVIVSNERDIIFTLKKGHGENKLRNITERKKRFLSGEQLPRARARPYNLSTYLPLAVN